MIMRLGSLEINKSSFLSFANWLPHGQLWANVMGEASLTQFSLQCFIFTFNPLGSLGPLLSRWDPQPSQMPK